MAKTIRVDMNIGEPDLTLKNAKKAVEKHTDMGLTSPLIGFVDMVAFNTKVEEAILMRKNAAKQTDLFQEKYNDAEVLAGTAKGQTRDSANTIYRGVVQVRDILLQKNRLTEEALQSWGFNVVISSTGARRNVRVDIPNNIAPQMIKLGRDIVEKHLDLGAGSPLTGNVDMAAFETLVSDGEMARGAWENAKDLAQELNNDALMLIGYGAGQTKDTVGTIYYDRCSIRDRLLQKYQGNEEHLQAFGFDVVISEHAAGRGGGGTPTPPQSVTLEGDLTAGSIIELNTDNFELTPSSTVTSEISGNEIILSASELAGPVLGSAQWHVLPGIQNKTAEAFKALVGADDTHSHLKIQDLGPFPGHYKITFNNVTVIP